jgi:Ca-activated chloride channel homolog
MMTFHMPWLLGLLVLVPPLLWLRYGRWRKTTLPFSDHRVLRALPTSWAVRARWILPLLYGIGLALLIVALARPQQGMDESRVKRHAVDIVMLVDVSTSMLAEDFALEGRRVNRMEVARAMVKDFIQKRHDDRIAVVAFGAVPYVMAPLTFDHGWLLQQVNRIKIAMVEDGTAIGSALASGLNRLRESEATSKVIVLLTDGVNNAGRLSPENAAQLAKGLDVRVHTVGIGTQDLAPFPMNDPFGGKRYVQQRAVFDEAQLRRVAETTGGTYFFGKDTETLFEINRMIDEMERTEIDVSEYTRYEERFLPFLIGALILLGLEQCLSLARLGRWP